MPGLTLSRTPRTTEPLSDVSRPVLAMIAQGAKRTTLADQVYDYRAGQYLIATVDLPLSAQVTEATPAQPFLGLGLPLKQHLIADLLLETGATTAEGYEQAADPAQQRRAGGPGEWPVLGRYRRGQRGVQGGRPPDGSASSPPTPMIFWSTRWSVCSGWPTTPRTSRSWLRRPSARSTGG